MVIIKILLDAGANINKAKGIADYWSVPARDTGSTPLFVATLEGRLEAIRYLVKAGAAVNKADCDGATPLYAASHIGHVKAMRFLIKAGASVDQADDAGSSPIYIAAQSGCVPAVKLLLKNGACSAKLMFDGCSPLHVAASHGHLANVKLLTTFHPNTPAWQAFLLGSGPRRELQDPPRSPQQPPPQPTFPSTHTHHTLHTPPIPSPIVHAVLTGPGVQRYQQPGPWVGDSG